MANFHSLLNTDNVKLSVCRGCSSHCYDVRADGRRASFSSSNAPGIITKLMTALDNETIKNVPVAGSVHVPYAMMQPVIDALTKDRDTGRDQDVICSDTDQFDDLDEEEDEE